MKKKLRYGVIGVGYFGKLHCKKLKAMNNVDLVLASDSCYHTLGQIADTFQISGWVNYENIVGNVDAVSITVPTSAHFETARFFIENKIHVFIEKPITTTVEEADTLIELARKNNVKIQVGMLERFNPILPLLKEKLVHPLFIECQRKSFYNRRGQDVNVILDLMIHDLDLLQVLIDSPIEKIEANGTAVYNCNNLDAVNARIYFANKSVVSVMANRISDEAERKWRIFTPSTYTSVDFQKYELTAKRSDNPFSIGEPNTKRVEVTEGNDPLHLEIQSFVDSILNDKPVVVDGEAGRNSLALALQVNAILNQDHQTT